MYKVLRSLRAAMSRPIHIFGPRRIDRILGLAVLMVSGLLVVPATMMFLHSIECYLPAPSTLSAVLGLSRLAGAVVCGSVSALGFWFQSRLTVHYFRRLTGDDELTSQEIKQLLFDARCALLYRALPADHRNSASILDLADSAEDRERRLPTSTAVKATLNGMAAILNLTAAALLAWFVVERSHRELLIVATMFAMIVGALLFQVFTSWDIAASRNRVLAKYLRELARILRRGEELVTWVHDEDKLALSKAALVVALNSEKPAA